MKLIDRRYTEKPFLGSPRMTDYLKDCGYHVNHKRVERLMKKMGLAAVFARRKPKRSQQSASEKKYPYLLSGLSITRPNQVWATDITYIPMSRGFVYLVAILDWYSRYVLSWELSKNLFENSDRVIQRAEVNVLI